MSTVDCQPMASVRLMALSASRRNSLFLQRCAMQSFKARFTFPTDVTQVIISHARCYIIFVECLFGHCLEMVISQWACPLRITQRGSVWFVSA
jgi:hypothetical protein